MLVRLIVVLVVILVSMTLHELAHGFVAYKLGDDTAKDNGRLTLNPLKHLDPVMSVALPLVMLLMGGPVFGGAKPVPVNFSKLKHGAWGAALVALAGPLTNFMLALIAYVLGRALGAIMVMDGALYMASGVIGLIFSYFVTVNLGFMIFNLIPIPPLDGSRILYAIAPDGVRNVLEKIEPMGIMVVMLIVVLLPGVISAIMSNAIDGVISFFGWLM